MRIQVNTNSSVQNDESLEAFVIDTVEKSLAHFREEVTRVEVHIRDVNRERGGADDKRCTMEARIEGLNPTAVSHNAGSVKDAINGASDKLRRAVDSAISKRRERR